MGLISEYKAFISQGNVVDLAVAVVIGAAFGKIVTSFVQDVVMPPIGLMMGGVNFSDLQSAVAIKYGAFFNTIFEFLIVAFAIFMVVKAINNMKAAEEEAPAEPTTEEQLLTEIRDALTK
ncbi:UNVERIFIED_CONTAM: hypothetical protein GTU68_010920 [Idotea baltica]|nr:hypothetical protein [Idotea baltica]